MGEIVRLCDIDISNSIYFTMTNPHYVDSLIMDFTYEYPRDRIRILEMFKFAQRLGLKMTYKSQNEEAIEWLDELNEVYIGDRYGEGMDIASQKNP